MDAWTSCHLAISVNVGGNERVGDFMHDGFVFFAQEVLGLNDTQYGVLLLSGAAGGIGGLLCPKRAEFWGAGVRYYALC